MRMIVFTQQSIVFLTDHPEHAEAILAHEVAHLKRDCLTLWKLRLLSRLGLVGIGFLSVLHDSIAMEDRADVSARRYLRDNGQDENLLAEAASMIEVEDYIDNTTNSLGRQISAGFSPKCKNNRTGGAQAKQSFFKIFVTAFYLAHDVYFWIDLYDYIHREAKYRGIQPNFQRMQDC